MTEMLRPLASVNVFDVVIFVALCFVIVESLLDLMSAPGAKFASCHTIALPFQPEDVVKP